MHILSSKPLYNFIFLQTTQPYMDNTFAQNLNKNVDKTFYVRRALREELPLIPVRVEKKKIFKTILLLPLWGSVRLLH